MLCHYYSRKHEINIAESSYHARCWLLQVEGMLYAGGLQHFQG